MSAQDDDGHCAMASYQFIELVVIFAVLIQTNVDEEELRNLVTEDSKTGNAKQIDGTVEIIAEALYFQTDRGTYEIDGDKLILHAKQGTMEFDLQVIDDENIVMTRNEKSAELTKVGNP